MNIEVTQQDINKGGQFDRYNCAIAQAIRRQYGLRIGDVEVLTGAIKFPGKQFELPIVVREFIQNFDRSRSLVSPFVFRLENSVPLPEFRESRWYLPPHVSTQIRPQNYIPLSMEMTV